jgi:hypothetical protein
VTASVASARAAMWALWAIAATAAIGAIWSAVDMDAPTAQPVVAPPAEQVPDAARTTEPPRDVEAPVLERMPVSDATNWVPGEVPEDQLERGEASLHFRLVGDTDAAPVAMRVRIWRLGVAESDTWTEGDEVRGTFEVPTRGDVATRLPTGRYRFQCLDLRHDGEDPPEFVVNGGKNERVLPVANRRTLQIRVRILDESGAPRTHAVIGDGGGGSSHSSGASTPPWATAREAKVGPRTGESRTSTRACGPGHPGVAVDADSQGAFPLRSLRESGVGGRQDHSYELRVDDDACATVRVSDRISTDTTYLWVVPRAAALLTHVIRPDGTAIDPAKARVDVTSEPLECAWDPPEGAWRSVSVRVRVHCEGFQPITFVWRGDSAGERHVLVPKSSK